MAAAPQHNLWIGPSGWSYDDWNGVVYPKHRGRGFKPLAAIGRLFNAVEVNTSFYRIPTQKMTSAWPALVPDRFRFAIKLTQSFTHQRHEFPAAADARAFKDALSPLRERGVLGPLLMQFPWSFRFDAAAVDWLKRLRDQFAEYDRVVEVRHASWAAPQALSVLREVGAYCNIDQPRLRDCVEPTSHVFGATAYTRLHGRNAQNWFADNVPAYERYNYLYADDEIRAWIDRIRDMATAADDVYVFTNNHYRGQAVVNGLEIKSILEEGKVSVPESLLDAYPRLERIALPPLEPGLFGP